jgi:hypothetical protein
MPRLAKIKMIHMLLPLYIAAEAHASAQDVHDIIDIW